jgi:hypothetical protein
MHWLIVTAVVVAGLAAAAFAIRARFRRGYLDVGPLSSQWVAQHRADMPPR